MGTEGFKWNLIAILNVDVGRYSRLIRDDEEATICALNAYMNIFIKMDLRWYLDELDKIASIQNEGPFYTIGKRGKSDDIEKERGDIQVLTKEKGGDLSVFEEIGFKGLRDCFHNYLKKGGINNEKIYTDNTNSYFFNRPGFRYLFRRRKTAIRGHFYLEP